jgi:uncharacterized protein YcaQ
MDTISPTTYRRFILGCQGLWPGRRWAGKAGAAQALRAVETVQVDPVAVVAQSHDIALWGRVADYRPEYLQELLYQDRQFFDYGGALFIYPVEEFPYWMVEMKRRATAPHWREYIKDNPKLFERVRAEIREHGPLGTRDLPGERVDRYRSSKDTGYAMYCLWITGELTIQGRKGRDRLYDFTDKLIPAQYLHTVSEAEAVEFFINKAIAQYGFVNEREFAAIWKNATELPRDMTAIKAKLNELLESGRIARVRRENSDETLYYPASCKPLLEELASGRVPAEWQPLGATTEEEVVFLSPLEFVSARGRAKKVFGFDYTWEIYKPAHTRKYGPYTMPMLYGDQLVARVDMRVDRTASTLCVNGLWTEEDFPATKQFHKALNNGLINFTRSLSIDRINRVQAFH